MYLLDKNLDDPRRRLLVQALATGLLGVALSPKEIQAALLGDVPKTLPAGRSIYFLDGDVKVNSVSATIDTKIGPNDTVETGSNGRIVFVVGKDSFMMRNNSKMVLKGSGTLLDSMLLLGGRVLSVFGKGKHQLRTPTAIVGIRGTGVYTEVDPEETYFCTCYGVTDIGSTIDKNAKETVSATHHDKPLFILAKASKGEHIRPAGFRNHTDEELMILEAIVGRTVPFNFSGAEYSAPRRDY
jgi:hypothetical protein